MKTDWKCEQCGHGGTVEHDRHAGVMEVVQLIADAHSLLAPYCRFDYSCVRAARHKEGQLIGDVKGGAA